MMALGSASAAHADQATHLHHLRGGLYRWLIYLHPMQGRKRDEEESIIRRGKRIGWIGWTGWTTWKLSKNKAIGLC
jgi:hypothetical protein